jgi:hypothetical protein
MDVISFYEKRVEAGGRGLAKLLNLRGVEQARHGCAFFCRTELHRQAKLASPEGLEDPFFVLVGLESVDEHAGCPEARQCHCRARSKAHGRAQSNRSSSRPAVVMFSPNSPGDTS